MATTKLRIAEICKEKGISTAELAERIGIKPHSLTQAIYRKTFSLPKLEIIADTLGVTIPELFSPSSSSSSSVDLMCPHCGKKICIAIDKR